MSRERRTCGRVTCPCSKTVWLALPARATLIVLFAGTSDVPFVTVAVAPKSLHLALETTIHIDPKDSNDTYEIINKISKFLTELKHAFKPALENKIRFKTRKPKKYIKNFLNDVARVILNFKYNETELFFKKLYHEIKSYLQYERSAFGDIVKNPIVKRYLLETLKEWSESGHFRMKMKIRSYLNRVKIGNGDLNRLCRFLNDYYEENDEDKMREFVRKLKYSTKERDFEKVIREGVNTLIIQHYDRFNYTVRMRITDEIKKLGDANQRRFINYGKLNSSNVNMDKGSGHSIVKINEITTHTTETKEAQEKTEHKVIGNTSVTEKCDGLSDIEVLKQNYSNSQSVPRGIKLKGFAKKKDIPERDFIYQQSKTKRRLEKLTTTTKPVPGIITPKVLKRFQLKLPPTQENDTIMNSAVKPDIKNETITSVPNTIHETIQNITVPRAIEDLTTKSSHDNGTSNTPTVVPQNINNESNISHVPPIINNGLKISTHVPTVINNQFKISTHVPQDIKNETYMKTIPVPRHINKPALRVETKINKYSNVTPGLRVIDISVYDRQPRTRKHTIFKPYNLDDIKKVYENTDNPYIGNREKYYVPPRARLTFKKKEILDIEDKIDAMDIDGK